jgi:hypothetical protein
MEGVESVTMFSKVIVSYQFLSGFAIIKYKIRNR